MSGGLQSDLGKMRNRVLATCRHGSHLIENELIAIFGAGVGETESEDQERK